MPGAARNFSQKGPDHVALPTAQVLLWRCCCPFPPLKGQYLLHPLQTSCSLVPERVAPTSGSSPFPVDTSHPTAHSGTCPTPTSPDPSPAPRATPFSPRPCTPPVPPPSWGRPPPPSEKPAVLLEILYMSLIISHTHTHTHARPFVCKQRGNITSPYFNFLILTRGHVY